MQVQKESPSNSRDKLFSAAADALTLQSSELKNQIEEYGIKPYDGMEQTYLVPPSVHKAWEAVVLQLVKDLDLLLGERAGKDYLFLDLINRNTGSDEVYLGSITFIEKLKKSLSNLIENYKINDFKLDFNELNSIRSLQVACSEIFKNEVYLSHAINRAPVFSLDISRDENDHPVNVGLRVMSIHTCPSGQNLQLFDERLYKLNLIDGAIELETQRYPITNIHRG
jgi:hypothetical protein